MSKFNLDLRQAEDHIDEPDEDLTDRVELGILDGTTPDGEWIEAVENGRVLVLSLEGDMNELASGFARDVKELGGELVHFRGFLIVTPPGIEIDNSRLA